MFFFSPPSLSEQPDSHAEVDIHHHGCKIIPVQIFAQITCNIGPLKDFTFNRGLSFEVMPKSHVITALAQQHNSAISLHFYVFRPRMMTELICSWHLSFAPVVCLPSKTQTGKVWQAPKATSAFVEDNIENCWKNRASSVRNGFPDVVKTNLAWQDRSCLKLELGIVQTCQYIGLDTVSRKILFLLPDVLNPIWTTTIHCRCSTKLVFHFNGDLGNQSLLQIKFCCIPGLCRYILGTNVAFRSVLQIFQSLVRSPT